MMSFGIDRLKKLGDAEAALSGTELETKHPRRILSACDIS